MALIWHIYTKTDFIIAKFLGVCLMNIDMQNDFCHAMLEPTDKHNIFKFLQKIDLMILLELIHCIRCGVMIPQLICKVPSFFGTMLANQVCCCRPCFQHLPQQGVSHLIKEGGS